MSDNNFNNPYYTVNNSEMPNINLPDDCNSGNGYMASSIEQINSGKYSSVENVMARLSRNNKNMTFDLYDVAEWCGECEVDEIGQYQSFAKFRGVQVKVKNNKAYLPCNVYRILSIHRNKCCIPKYDWDGAYARFNLDDPATFNQEYIVEIDYLGVMIDDKGFPLILDGHQEACYWYCMTKLYFEPYMNKEIDESRWQTLQENFGKYVMKVKQSMRNMSRDDMNQIMMIRYNMVQKIKMSRNVD